MKKGFTLIALLILITAVIAGGFWVFRKLIKGSLEKSNSFKATEVPLRPVDVNDEGSGGASPTSSTEAARVSVVSEGLDTPWAIGFLPEGGLLVTERKGTVRQVNSNGELLKDPVASISRVQEIGEGGLQGIAIHPDFSKNNFVYLYYTYASSGDNTMNRVVRMIYNEGKLSNEEIIVDEIPGASNHDGGRIKFGPDKFLYVTTGDAQEPSLAQSRDSLAGKILRVTDDGKPAPGNPFGNRTYSYGHRNPQGIAWDNTGQLWSTEHGPSGFETGNDEFNKIEPGRNYGWPDIKGTQTKEGMVTPITESGRGNAWAPAGVAYLPAQAGINGKFFFGGLRGSALYELDAGGKNLKTHFKGEFGRLREVVAGPDGLLYITTSNLDGRGVPKEGDDKILRVNPNKL